MKPAAKGFDEFTFKAPQGMILHVTWQKDGSSHVRLVPASATRNSKRVGVAEGPDFLIKTYHEAAP